MTAKVQPQLISRFLRAMKSVYGPFDRLTPAQATTWTPPPMAEGHRGRYLWTDAFGVLNLLTLGVLTSNALYTTLAARLVDTVHDTLGRTRDGARRLPGASDAHPLAGGLRIGKEDEEDDPGGDGDGQYHHYLTIWMFALNRMTHATGERRYNDLAIELAKAIHPRFVRDRDSARPRMYWKMSIDLSRPMVLSEGNLDPIDGYVVFSLLQRSHEGNKAVLAEEIDEYRRILETKWRRYVSDDPLDLGMTLWTAHWFDGEEQWATELSRRAAMCLREYLAALDLICVEPEGMRMLTGNTGQGRCTRRRSTSTHPRGTDSPFESLAPVSALGAWWQTWPVAPQTRTRRSTGRRSSRRCSAFGCRAWTEIRLWSQRSCSPSRWSCTPPR
ncbi:hypothetical protein BV20DRAFT_966520 [Pilatotrama ljubarskyi]|nr:hypothetical protein BV20DRAFT_966520 [Pilatotrama ljubarskyi]